MTANTATDTAPDTAPDTLVYDGRRTDVINVVIAPRDLAGYLTSKLRAAGFRGTFLDNRFVTDDMLEQLPGIYGDDERYGVPRPIRTDLDPDAFYAATTAWYGHMDRDPEFLAWCRRTGQDDGITDRRALAAKRDPEMKLFRALRQAAIASIPVPKLPD